MSTIYIPNSIPVKGVTHTFYTALISQADTDILQVNPTLAVGDVKISIDGGALANITALPVVTPAGSKMVKVVLSAAEMTGNKIMVLFSDAAGAEWQDSFNEIVTNVASGNVYIPNSPMLKNTAFTFFVPLISQADTDIFQANPTLAAGDAKVSIDGGALNNPTTLPVVTPAASKIVKVVLSAAEMNGNKITVVFCDAAGNEWQDAMFVIDTESAASDSPTIGSDLDMICGITFSQTITGLTIPATWTKIYLTIKEFMDEDDTHSILQIVVSNPGVGTDGILYLDETVATALIRTYGTLVVNQGAGSIAVIVMDEGTALIPPGKYSYDLKCLVAAGTTTQLSSGNCTVAYTETRA